MRILVIHGAGMELRGKVDIEKFGTMTIDGYSSAIRSYARDLGVEVEIFHSLEEAAVIAVIEGSRSNHFDAILINPANFTVGRPALAQALKAIGLPSVEVHVSNPAGRGLVSDIAKGTTSAIAGFGVAGYRLALQGLRDAAQATGN